MQFERETRVDAPLDAVWEFHSRVEGLEALTPSWARLRVESVRGPDGEPDPGVLEAGSTVSLSVRPFGIGPWREWTSRIVERERTAEAASFRDEMVEGPADRWAHTHAFYADDGGTIVRDRVDFVPPFGPLGAAVAPASRIGLEPLFRHRHRRTRELLE